jgi:hypothetical protein
VEERIDAMIDRAVKRLVQTKAMKQMGVSASPRGGDDQPPKKIQTASLRDQEEHSTIKTAKADSAREHLRGKRSGGGHRRSSRTCANALAVAQPETCHNFLVGPCALPIGTRSSLSEGTIRLKGIDLIRLVSMALGRSAAEAIGLY